MLIMVMLVGLVLLALGVSMLLLGTGIKWWLKRRKRPPQDLPDSWFYQEHGRILRDLHRDSPEDFRVNIRREWQWG